MRVRSATENFDGQTMSVALARRFVRDTLTSWAAADGYEWRATTVISELATNAVLHAGTAFAVSLTLGSDRLTIEVSDGSVRLPKVRRYDAGATTGRGLLLVNQLCLAWQAQPTSAGKVVRCELGSDDEQPRSKSESDSGGDIAVLLEQFPEHDEPTGPWNRAVA